MMTNGGEQLIIEGNGRYVSRNSSEIESHGLNKKETRSVFFRRLMDSKGNEQYVSLLHEHLLP
jgi:hypothetical protein